MVRLRLVVAYLGTPYRGFAAQPGQPTVAGALAGALERHLRHPVELTCAGRTDAGVHAWGQVVSFDARPDVDSVALVRSVNKTLRPHVVVRAAEVAPAGFDARRDATARRYRYQVLNTPVGDPFLAATAWHVPRPLDLRAMRLACDPLYGEHDFASFCRRPRLTRPAPGDNPPPEGDNPPPEGDRPVPEGDRPVPEGDRPVPEGGKPVPEVSLVRRVCFADWVEVGEGLLRFEIEASSFCHQMVRSVVGTMVEMGLGRRRAGEMSGILAAADRSGAGQPAPPHGLCLWEVRY